MNTYEYTPQEGKFVIPQKKRDRKRGWDKNSITTVQIIIYLQPHHHVLTTTKAIGEKRERKINEIFNFY